MPRYLLDTNVWSVFLRGRDENVRCRIDGSNPSDLIVCSIVRAELLHGWVRNARPAGLGESLQKLFKAFPSLAFTNKSAEQYANIRAKLEEVGGIIGPNDILIAAIALAHDLTLVTHNTREFHRVINLRVEDWQQTGE